MTVVDKLPQDFADLLTELTEAGAEFLVVGGWAVVLHGHVRSTDDLDVFVRPTIENSERVVRGTRTVWGAAVLTTLPRTTLRGRGTHWKQILKRASVAFPSVEELVEEGTEDGISAASDAATSDEEPKEGALGTGFDACDPGAISSKCHEHGNELATDRRERTRRPTIVRAAGCRC